MDKIKEHGTFGAKVALWTGILHVVLQVVTALTHH